MKLLPHGTWYSGRPKSMFPVHGHLNLLPECFVWIFTFHTLMINSGFKDKARPLCPTLSSPMFKKSPHTQKGLLKVLGQVSWVTNLPPVGHNNLINSQGNEACQGERQTLWHHGNTRGYPCPLTCFLLLTRNPPAAHSHVLLSLCRTPLQLDLSPQPSHELPRWLETRACLPKSSCPSTCELSLMSVGILCTLAFTQVVSSGVFS